MQQNELTESEKNEIHESVKDLGGALGKMTLQLVLSCVYALFPVLPVWLLLKALLPNGYPLFNTYCALVLLQLVVKCVYSAISQKQKAADKK